MTRISIKIIQAQTSEAATVVCMCAKQMFDNLGAVLVLVTLVLFRVYALVVLHPFFITTVEPTKLTGILVKLNTIIRNIFFSHAVLTGRPFPWMAIFFKSIN